MKTFKITKLFLVMTFGIISLVSCEKTDQSSNPNGTPTPSVVKDMVVKDYGPINDTTRNMEVLLTSQDYSLTNSNDILTGRGAELRVRFFSNQDNAIPSGNYTYALTPDKLPFTFSDATMHINDNSVVHGVFVIYYGSVSVQSDGSKYSVLFNGVLSNGYTFSAKYDGNIVYSDNF